MTDESGFEPVVTPVPGIVFGLLLVMGVAGCDGLPAQNISMGTLEVDRISLVADSNEPITEIYVSEGDRVTSEQVLVRQDPARINVGLKLARAELAVASARLDQAQTGPRVQDIEAARARVAAAASDVKTARLELDRERALVENNFAARNQVDVLEGRYESAVARKDEAEAILARLREGTRIEELDAARSNFDMAEARVQDMEITLARAHILAPVEGIVESVIFEVGERPPRGAVVLTIVRDQVPYARVHVPEPVRTRLSAGAEAEISIDGYESAFKGRLRWIAHDASYTPYFALTQHDRSHLSYLAEVDLIDERAPAIATGVPVQVHFPGVD